MGLRVAVANGNWSNPSTWEGGIIPTATDIVAANGFTVNIDQDITVECLTNIAHPANSVPLMIYSNSPSGVVTASSEYDSATYAMMRAFDGNTSTAWLTQNGIPFGWLSYEFKIPKVITRYKIIPWTSNTSSMPKDWTFEAWDGSDWIILDTVTNHPVSSYVGTFSNTVAYSKYRINATSNTAGSYMGIGEFILDNIGDRETPSISGGAFTVTSGIVITCTQAGLYSGLPLITISSAGTYNFVSNLAKTAAGSVLNITGGSPTINIVGDLKAHSGGLVITANLQYLLNITGNLIVYEDGTSCVSIVNATICTITGNIIGETLGSNQTQAISVSGATCNMTGNVFYTKLARAPLVVNEGGVLSIVGTIDATGTSNTGANAIYNGFSSTAVNMLSGPFIFSINGVNPVMVARMHLIPVFNSYVEFRDNSTDGALPPAIQAPATRLVSPDTVADAPSPNNVRLGVSYSSGVLTGTMIVPSPDNVSKNIPVDDTVGTAVLDATAIWAVPLPSINTSNSIGKRVKSAATIETTGAQIQSAINNNE